ncbi:MAG: transketolase C-terminal domain-containing protein [Bacteroidales bacterium]|nr:transketolase C-terminal domain-containing protein [Bacteroidales bacterium]
MRTAFIKQLIEETRTNERIFLIVGDLGYNVVEAFRDAYPDRFLNVGIDEQNMAGIAAGLSMQGFIVYIYSIGNFPTLRCMEQIRFDIAYHHANVKVVAVGAGLSYADLGATHHATEEVGMLRSIPNMVIASPSDPNEARAITKISANYEGPMYIRLGKAGEKEVYPKYEDLTIGNIHCYQESDSENALLVTGSIMDYAVNWINENNVQTAIFSVPFIKPLNKKLLAAVANKHHNIITLEEHQKSCGVGSAFIEQLSDLYQEGKIAQYPKIRRIAMNDSFIEVAGNHAYLRQYAELVLNKEYFV